jgi:hypothetical protein
LRSRTSESDTPSALRPTTGRLFGHIVRRIRRIAANYAMREIRGAELSCFRGLARSSRAVTIATNNVRLEDASADVIADAAEFVDISLICLYKLQ